MDLFKGLGNLLFAVPPAIGFYISHYVPEKYSIYIVPVSLIISIFGYLLKVIFKAQGIINKKNIDLSLLENEIENIKENNKGLIVSNNKLQTEINRIKISWSNISSQIDIAKMNKTSAKLNELFDSKNRLSYYINSGEVILSETNSSENHQDN